MHLSIPESTEWFQDAEKKTGQYTEYTVCCNGVFICSVRYSKLLTLHETLLEEFPEAPMAEFPPKQWFTLSEHDLEHRRRRLEKWIQKITELPEILNSATFTTFLLEAQEEVIISCEQSSLTVYLVNGKSVEIEGLSTDQTDEVLEAVCDKLGVNPDLTYYFQLVVVDGEGEAKSAEVARTMQHFESPHVALKRAKIPQSIQLRKAYWAPIIDSEVLGDEVATNLLYIEAMQEIKSKNYVIEKDSMKQELKEAREAGDKQKFVQICGAIPFHNFWTWKGCVSDHPAADLKVTVKIGTMELVLIAEEGERTGQSAVDELLRLRAGRPVRKPKDRQKRKKSSQVRAPIERKEKTVAVAMQRSQEEQEKELREKMESVTTEKSGIVRTERTDEFSITENSAVQVGAVDGLGDIGDDDL